MNIRIDHQPSGSALLEITIPESGVINAYAIPKRDKVELARQLTEASEALLDSMERTVQ